jgi:hypothetical protein
MLIRGTVRPVSGASDILAKKDCNINELFIADSDSRENSKTFERISRIVRSTVQNTRRENWHLAKKTLTFTGRNDLAVKPKNHQRIFYCRFGFAGKF